ncbi:MAG: transposase, partial [Gammaproteobacteria bacterium]
MAKLVSKITLGVDVAKDECVVCDWQSDKILTLPNQNNSIKACLQSMPGNVQIAIEPTSHYHMAWVEEALALGYEVYLINPR